MKFKNIEIVYTGCMTCVPSRSQFVHAFLQTNSLKKGFGMLKILEKFVLKTKKHISLQQIKSKCVELVILHFCHVPFGVVLHVWPFYVLFFLPNNSMYLFVPSFSCEFSQELVYIWDRLSLINNFTQNFCKETTKKLISLIYAVEERKPKIQINSKQLKRKAKVDSN